MRERGEASHLLHNHAKAHAPQGSVSRNLGLLPSPGQNRALGNTHHTTTAQEGVPDLPMTVQLRERLVSFG